MTDRLAEVEVAVAYMAAVSSPDCTWSHLSQEIDNVVAMKIPFTLKMKKQLLGHLVVAQLQAAQQADKPAQLVSQVLDTILFFDVAKDEIDDDNEGNASWMQRLDAQAASMSFDPKAPRLAALHEMKLHDRMELCLHLITTNFLTTLVGMQEAGVSLMKAITHAIIEGVEHQMGLIDDDVPEAIESMLVVCRAAYTLVDFSSSLHLSTICHSDDQAAKPTDFSGPQRALRCFLRTVKECPYYSELYNDLLANLPVYKKGYPNFAASVATLGGLKLVDEQSWKVVGEMVHSIVSLRQGVRKGATIDFEKGVRELILKTLARGKSDPSLLSDFVVVVEEALGKAVAFWKECAELKTSQKCLLEYKIAVNAKSNLQALVKALEDCGRPFVFENLNDLDGKLTFCNGIKPETDHLPSLEASLESAVQTMVVDFPTHSLHCAVVGKLAIVIGSHDAAKRGLKVQLMGVAAQVDANVEKFEALGIDLPSRLLNDDQAGAMSDIIRSLKAFDQNLAKAKILVAELGPGVERTIQRCEEIVNDAQHHEITTMEKKIQHLVSSFSGKARGGKDGAEWHEALAATAADEDLYELANKTLLKNVANASANSKSLDDDLTAYRDISNRYGKPIDKNLITEATSVANKLLLSHAGALFVTLFDRAGKDEMEPKAKRSKAQGINKIITDRKGLKFTDVHPVLQAKFDLVIKMKL